MSLAMWHTVILNRAHRWQQWQTTGDCQRRRTKMKFLLLCLGLILVFSAYALRPLCAQTQSPSLLGRWKVEFKFSSIEEHSLRLDAASGGKGAFLLLDIG